MISGAGEKKSSDVNNIMKNLRNSNDYKNHAGVLSLLTWKKFTHEPTIVPWVYGLLSSPASHFPTLHMLILKLKRKTIKNGADRLSCPDQLIYILHHLSASALELLNSKNSK